MVSVQPPIGVELYSLTEHGAAWFTDRAGREDLLATDDAAQRLLPFIDDGQRARYFVGDRGSSPQRPSHATVKLGVVRPHSGFTPHAHGGEHFVLSLGYASCGLYDVGRQATVTITLTPGMMIRIPAMMPHSFGNRGRRPLLILAANTGHGIDHEDYAITAAEAERRAVTPDDGTGIDYAALASKLRSVPAGPPGAVAWRERIAGRLRRLAARLEGTA